MLRVFPDGFCLWCAFRFCRGASPLALVPSGPLGGCGDSTNIALHRTWLVSAVLPGALVLQSVFYVLLCVIPPAFMAIFWSVSLTPACPLRVTPIWGCSLDTCVACTWLDLLSSSALFQDSVICADFWSRQSGPHTACDRHSVAFALSPSITVVLTPCYCGMLGGLPVLVGSSTYPSPGCMLEPSWVGRLLCLWLG